jgi:hypothetical protein
MAITFQYGPAAGAIGLATKAGQGQRQQDLFNQGIQFNQLINQEQARLDQKNANAISQALGVDEFNTHTALADRNFNAEQQQQSVNNDYRTQEAKSQDEERAAARAIQQQNANTQAQNANTNSAYRTATTDLKNTKYQTQQDALDEMNPDQANMIRANGHLPGQQQQDQTRLLISEYRRLDASARQAQKDADAARYDENDVRKLTAQQSTTVPGSIAGMEDRFVQSTQRLQAFQARMKQIDDQINNGTRSAVDPNGTVDKNLGQKLIQQQQNPQQSAPAQQPRIVETATNPKTGQRIGFDANTGRWVSI